MEVPLLMLLVLFLVTYIQRSVVATLLHDEELKVTRQLDLINKPATKTFVTKYGDILDCVEIDKQLAFDHPLLKNHSIQMKPNFKIPKRRRLNTFSSSTLIPSQRRLPKKMRCPKGTVLIKRIQEEDLAMEKFSPSLGMKFPTSKSYNFAYPNDDQPPQVHNQVAALVTFTQNTGAAGIINLWSPEVKPDQYSDAVIFVANDDGVVANAIVIGWTVNPLINQTFFTRLYTYWTKDSGQSTGCYNAMCAGFVQTSQEITLGQILSPISVYWGRQYYVDLTVRQDLKTKNWWLLNGEDSVGYWPKELFTTLTNGAIRAGWGGEIQSPVTETAPGMGSGHFAKEGYARACLMKDLKLYAPMSFPAEKDLKLYLSKPNCYGVLYEDAPGPGEGGEWGHCIFFGGPPGCSMS
ncbi:hypothetical protein BVRB_5g100430 [Beta vulgaris subsp. vulgaris]|nr:hypothetical protein BVRB_5g100430 [Beta vulgaris subsp. vulgaris]